MSNIEHKNEETMESELSELSEELRMAMAGDANSVARNREPRRAFLKRVVQISLPVGALLATAGKASACWVCETSCDLCKEQFWDICLGDICTYCESAAELCPNNRACPNGLLEPGCDGWNEMQSSPRKPLSPNLDSTPSNGINKQLE